MRKQITIFKLLFWCRSDAPLVCIYLWNSVINIEFIGLRIVGILLTVVDSLAGIGLFYYIFYEADSGILRGRSIWTRVVNGPKGLWIKIDIILRPKGM